MQKICSRAAALAAALFLLLVPLAVRAEDTKAAVQIPVTVKLEGNMPSSDLAFTVTLAAKTASDPMPEASSLEIKVHNGEGSGSFAPITYTIPGDYHYTVVQKPCTQSGVKCDNALYEVTVRVVNGDSGLCAEVFARKSGTDCKTGVVSFVNCYRAPGATAAPSPTAAPTSPPPPQPAHRAPQTGDNSTPLLWGALAILSAAVMAVLIIRARRKAGK